MDFGHLNDISRVDFDLPPDSDRSLALLRARGGKKTLQVWSGAPVWGAKAWLGSFYPTNAKPKDFLMHYAARMSAIELNPSFYRIPDPAMVDQWRAVTPTSFRFCPKVFQEISHREGLVKRPGLIDAHAEACLQMGERLGLSFLQLPPEFDPRRAGELAQFFARLPEGFPIAVEFRHPAWFKSGELIDLACDALERAGASTVITDVAGRRDVSHASLTSPRVLVRFIGNRLHPSDYRRLDDWVERIGRWREAGLEELYFFCHQPDDVEAPELVSEFVVRMNRELGLSLHDWRTAGPMPGLAVVGAPTEDDSGDGESGGQLSLL